MPYLANNNAAMMPVYRNPPPQILHPHLPPPSNYFLNQGSPRMFPSRPSFYSNPSPYQAGVYGHLGSRLNSYKRKQSDGDIEMRKNNKKRKKPLSQNIPQRKDWSVSITVIYIKSCKTFSASCKGLLSVRLLSGVKQKLPFGMQLRNILGF